MRCPTCGGELVWYEGGRCGDVTSVGWWCTDGDHVFELLSECAQCGADLYLDLPHECPVGGNTVLITTGVGKETDGS